MSHDNSEEISWFTRPPQAYMQASPRDDESSSSDTECAASSNYGDASHQQSYQNASRATRPTTIADDTAGNDDVRRTGKKDIDA